jgi:hypothetical protein
MTVASVEHGLLSEHGQGENPNLDEVKLTFLYLFSFGGSSVCILRR